MRQTYFPRQRHVILLGMLFLLSLALTWPLVLHFATHVPGNGIDDPALAWNLWWSKERFVDQLDPDFFHADWMFHPVNINLAFYTLTPLNGLISISLQSALNLIVATNLILISTYVIGGYGAFLLCRQSLLHHYPQQGINSSFCWIAAGFGGLAYAFASPKLFYAALGQFNITSSHWIPYCLLYLMRIRSLGGGRGQNPPGVTKEIRAVLLCALFLTLQAWSELTYASFLVIFIVLYVLVVTLLDRRASDVPALPVRVWHNIRPFIFIAALFAVGIAPLLAVMLVAMRQEGDFFASGGGFADVFSADLVGYLLPTRLHPLLGPWVAKLQQQGFSNDVGQHIYLGYTLLALGILGGYGWLKGKCFTRGWFWLLCLTFFWMMTWGPNLRWFGEPLPVRGPFAIISQLPFFSGNRYPSRYGVLLLLCGAVLAAHGVARLLRGRKEKRQLSLGLIVGLVFIVEHLSIPLPLNLSVSPSIYSQIARLPGDFTLLELPTGWRNGAYVLGKSDKLIMMQQWYQSVHEKRRLGGNTSRNPWHKFEYFINAPLIGDLIALMNADLPHFEPVIARELDSLIAHNRIIAPDVLDFLDIRYVTVHVERSPAALLRFVDEALPLTLLDEWQGSDWEGRAATIRLYEVNARVSSAATAVQIDMSTPSAQLSIAEGWAPLTSADGYRYATRAEATLLVNFPSEAGVLEITWCGDAMDVWLNEERLKPLPLRGGDALGTAVDKAQRTRFNIPPGVAHSSVDRLYFRFGGYEIPLRHFTQQQNWRIGSTGFALDVGNSLLLMSAGAESGKFARVRVNGQNVMEEGRGYNLVALTPAGEVLDAQSFDTIADRKASGEMARWVRSWPTGTIIGGAVGDAADAPAGGQLDDEWLDALITIGADEDMRGRHRWAHAFVGVVGAPPGTALEEAQLHGIVKLFVASPIDTPSVAGGIKSLRFTVE